MKVDKIITSKEDINIIGARLLTKEEAESLPKRLRLHHDWWWTSSASLGSTGIVLFVDGYDGGIDNGYADEANLVRPVIIFESEDIKIGDRFIVGGIEFEVITSGLAFCLGYIGECVFRRDLQAEDANQYEKSDIKKYIDEWFEENVS